MIQQFCQSCGMPLTDTNKGTNSDGSMNDDYCSYCYQKSKFTQDFTMNQMIEFCTQFTDQINKESGWNLTPEQAKEQMRQFFPTLKRWKQKDERTLTEKATWCKIHQCCIEKELHSCDDCTMNVKDCKIHNNVIGKIFAFLFNSDRATCIRYIQINGYKAFAEEMTRRKAQAMRKK